MEATDHYMETPTKICPVCKGKGFAKFNIELTKGLTLPAYQPCKECGSDGYVHLSDEEIQMEREGREDDEAEKMED